MWFPISRIEWLGKNRYFPRNLFLRNRSTSLELDKGIGRKSSQSHAKFRKYFKIIRLNMIPHWWLKDSFKIDDHNASFPSSQFYSKRREDPKHEPMPMLRKVQTSVSTHNV